MSSSALRPVSLRTPHRIFLSCAVAFSRLTPSPPPRLDAVVVRARAFSSNVQIECQNECGGGAVVEKKPSICTADELQYVSVNNSDWRLALWRYHPSPQVQLRNHPLLLLSGVGTNAIGYDLSPESSLERYMSGKGFDTWILEVRGAGLSMHGAPSKEIEQSAHEISEKMQAAFDSAADGGFVASTQQSPGVSRTSEQSDVAVTTEYLTEVATIWDKSKLVTTLTETFIRLSERLSGFLSEGLSGIISAKFLDQTARLFENSFVEEPFNEIRGKLLSLVETRESSAVVSQNKELSEKLVNVIEEGQLSVSPRLFDLQERLTSTIEDFQKQLDLIVKYDWDFDHCLEEDVPAAVR